MKNKNKCIVKVKKERVCKICGKKIKAGTQCVTINPRCEPRYWACLNHIEERKHCALYSQIKSLQMALGIIPSNQSDSDFDDEGKYYAYADILNELEDVAGCDGCKRKCDLKNDEDDFLSKL